MPPHRIAHRIVHRRRYRYARHQEEGSSSYYSYREAETVTSQSHGEWHVAPSDAVIPGPSVAYYPPPPPPGPGCNCGDSMHIDQSGWTGGVGYTAWSGGFMDGYGVMHYGGSFADSASYNGYGQGFRGGMPGPFQPRVMGGFSAGAGMGFGPRR
jgi:hypothetical protein